jgi:carbon storage regulator CsrA
LCIGWTKRSVKGPHQQQTEIAMLVLSRREGEAIIFETNDGPIEVRLTRIDGQQAKIGIGAPKAVRIIREELLLTLDTRTLEL